MVDFAFVAAPVPENFPQLESSADAAGAAASSPAWQEYFADEQLHVLIVQALKHNRGLCTAVPRVEEARAAYGIERRA